MSVHNLCMCTSHLSKGESKNEQQGVDSLVSSAFHRVLSNRFVKSSHFLSNNPKVSCLARQKNNVSRPIIFIFKTNFIHIYSSLLATITWVPMLRNIAKKIIMKVIKILNKSVKICISINIIYSYVPIKYTSCSIKP